MYADGKVIRIHPAPPIIEKRQISIRDAAIIAPTSNSVNPAPSQQPGVPRRRPISHTGRRWSVSNIIYTRVPLSTARVRKPQGINLHGILVVDRARMDRFPPRPTLVRCALGCPKRELDRPATPVQSIAVLLVKLDPSLRRAQFAFIFYGSVIVALDSQFEPES